MEEERQVEVIGSDVYFTVYDVYFVIKSTNKWDVEFINEILRDGTILYSYVFPEDDKYRMMVSVQGLPQANIIRLFNYVNEFYSLNVTEIRKTVNIMR